MTTNNNYEELVKEAREYAHHTGDSLTVELADAVESLQRERDGVIAANIRVCKDYDKRAEELERAHNRLICAKQRIAELRLFVWDAATLKRDDDAAKEQDSKS